MPAIRAISLLNGATVGVFLPFVAVILAGRGASPGAIGALLAVTSVAFVVSVPAWGHIGDVVLGRRRALAVSALGAAAASLIAGSPAPGFVAVVAFVAFYAFYSAWAPLTDALVVNALTDHSRQYGRIRVMMSLSFAVMSLLAGALYGVTGYDAAFVLCAALACVLGVTALLAPDVARADLMAADAGRAARGSFAVALRLQPRLWGVLAAILLVHVGMASSYTFLSLRIVDLGAGPEEVALLVSVAAFVEIPAMLLVGGLVARVGIRIVVAGCVLLYAVFLATLVVVTDPMVIIAVRAVTGIAFAGLWVSNVLTMAVLLPPRLQATGQGLYQVTGFGLAAVIANVGGGIIYERIGATAVFGVASVLAIVALVVTLFVYPRTGARVAREEDFEPVLPLSTTSA